MSSCLALATSSGSPSAPLKIIQHSRPIKKHFTSALQYMSFSPCWSERHTIDKPNIIYNEKNVFLRSDSGGEYMSTEFSQYLISRGTVHRGKKDTYWKRLERMNVPRLGRSCVDRNILDQSHTV